jgi:hypothetical protein
MVGHTTSTCWYRYDEDFVLDNRMVAMGSSSPIDPNWYLNSGVTDHITGELEALTMHEKYSGNDQIRAVTGTGMDIIHVSNTVLPSMSRSLHLNNSFMFLMPINTAFPFIGLILTTIPLLNYIPIFLDQGSGHEEGSTSRAM